MHNGPEGHAVTAFQDYMSKQWLGHNVTLISCYQQIHKTTNHVEGWHARLNRNITKHPPVIYAIDTIHNEAINADYIMSQYNSHIPRLARNKNQRFALAKDKCINDIVWDFLSDKEDIGTCLKNLSNRT